MGTYSQGMHEQAVEEFAEALVNLFGEEFCRGSDSLGESGSEIVAHATRVMAAGPEKAARQIVQQGLAGKDAALLDSFGVESVAARHQQPPTFARWAERFPQRHADDPDPRDMAPCSRCRRTFGWHGYDGLCGWCHDDPGVEEQTRAVPTHDRTGEPLRLLVRDAT